MVSSAQLNLAAPRDLVARLDPATSGAETYLYPLCSTNPALRPHRSLAGASPDLAGHSPDTPRSTSYRR